VDAPRVAVHGGAFGSQAWRTTAQRGRRVGRASKDARPERPRAMNWLEIPVRVWARCLLGSSTRDALAA